jgi:hypothetical protein
MALSPEYGWPEPDNSSLVKNGAQDIRALGDAIDTSVWNVGYGQAAKNKIINGDFSINQRSFVSTVYSGSSFNNYGFDRFITENAGDGTTTASPQTFTVGAAPVAGYEGKNFYRAVVASQTTAASRSGMAQYIEDVRTFANQTITVSFWAKAGTGTPKIALEIAQVFGTTGSPSAAVYTQGSPVTLSTSWVRYSISVAVPSISGKTLTAGNNTGVRLWLSGGSDFNTRASSIGIQNNTFDIWGVQAEYGSKATPFQTASGGSIQGELAMCQRYYYRVDRPANNGYGFIGSGVSTTLVTISVPAKVSMRIRPSSIDYSNLAAYDLAGSVLNATTATLYAAGSSNDAFALSLNYASGITQFRPYFLFSSTGSDGYIGFNAEL